MLNEYSASPASWDQVLELELSKRPPRSWAQLEKALSAHPCRFTTIVSAINVEGRSWSVCAGVPTRTGKVCQKPSFPSLAVSVYDSLQDAPDLHLPAGLHVDGRRYWHGEGLSAFFAPASAG